MQDSKFRHEIKFVLPLTKVTKFLKDIDCFCRPDEHADENATYEVASLYYDTKDFRFFWDREESVGYRRKLRLRAYIKENKVTALFFEIKEKHKHLVVKKRSPVNMLWFNQQIQKYENTFKLPLHDLIANIQDESVRREVDFLFTRLDLVPTSLNRYIRVTYVSKTENDVRVTLDKRLTVGGQDLGTFDETREKFLLAPSMGILEVKCNKQIPMWLSSILKENEFSRTKFSKYCVGLRTTHETKLGEDFRKPGVFEDEITGLSSEVSVNS